MQYSVLCVSYSSAQERLGTPKSIRLKPGSERSLSFAGSLIKVSVRNSVYCDAKARRPIFPIVRHTFDESLEGKSKFAPKLPLSSWARTL
jgi:hypothetical protein